MASLTEVQHSGNQLWLKLSGELNFNTTQRLFREGCRRFDKAPSAVIVDLKEVQKANSAGLALLLEWYRYTQRRRIQLKYRHLPKRLREFGEGVKVIGILPIEETKKTHG